MKSIINENQGKKEFKRLRQLKVSNEIYRLGMLFNTEFNNYFYDTGTGKVLMIEDNIYYLLNALFTYDANVEEFEHCFKQLSFQKQKDFLNICERENLLLAPKVKKMELCIGELDDQINHHTQQLILEVTERCNFRCKYCIYNEDYEGNRNFGTADMDWKTAKKAIDHIMEHSADKVAVTFYGGEPLIKFNLIKDCIEYALIVGKHKELVFSITSNMTLITEEIAEYLSGIPGLSLIASIDGPEYVHNAARVYTKNEPTFNDVIRGLKYISDAFKKTGNVLLINAVLIPPYTYQKIEDINTFFENLEFLAPETDIRITYPSEKTYKHDGIDQFLRNPKYYLYNTVDPLLKWQINKFVKNLSKSKSNNIYQKRVFDLLVSIYQNFFVQEPEGDYVFNGCCSPGARKIYVKTDGDILVCERIGESPILGNINTGLDIAYIKKIFVAEYMEKSLPDCSTCWAINICKNCYISCYDKSGFNLAKKRKNCRNILDSLQQDYAVFYSFVEKYPEIIDAIKVIDLPE